MSDTFVQLPYTGTTSGDLLDGEALTVGANAVKRERMQISGSAASQIAPVSSSGGLLVTLSTLTNTVTLSSNPTVSIGAMLVTPAVAPVDAISAAYQPITTSGGGLITVSSGSYLIRSLSSGLISVTGSSGVIAQVTSSGGMQVHVTNQSAGSTAVNVVGSTGTQVTVTSAGTMRVESTAHSYALVTATAGAPTVKTVTTAPAALHGYHVVTSVATFNYWFIWNSATETVTATGGLPSSSAALYTGSLAAVGVTSPFISLGGLNFPNGIQAGSLPTLGATASAIAQYMVVDYRLT